MWWMVDGGRELRCGVDDNGVRWRLRWPWRWQRQLVLRRQEGRGDDVCGDVMVVVVMLVAPDLGERGGGIWGLGFVFMEGKP